VPIDLPRSVLYPLSVIYIAGSAAVAGYDRVIAPPVRITWTAARLGKELPRGLLIALLGGLPSGLLFGYLRGWVNGLIGGLMFGLILAFLILLQDRLRVLRRHESIDGTSLSALQVALVSSRFGLPFGLVVGATYGVVAALHFGWPVGLGQGTIIAFAFSIFSGLYLWLAIGGRAYLQHAVLRALLVRQGVLPWRIRRFLDDMVRSTLLRRESGGYSFLHDLLLAYLAAEPRGRAGGNDE
jgi:hypothetical protein